MEEDGNKKEKGENENPKDGNPKKERSKNC
jgi:hypothetical protein